jgi:hypothetical protein
MAWKFVEFSIQNLRAALLTGSNSAQTADESLGPRTLIGPLH